MVETKLLNTKSFAMKRPKTVFHFVGLVTLWSLVPAILFLLATR